MKFVLLALLILSIPAKADESEELFQSLLELANAGDAEAAYGAGMFYNNGIATAVNIEKAYAMFKFSAENGDPLGAYKLGCYYAGQGGAVVPLDEEKALHYKLVAAKAGYSLAQHDVAVSYIANKDYTNALYWMRQSAEQGWREAILSLHKFYAHGLGVEPDPALSFAYLKLAAIVGMKVIDPELQAGLDGIRDSLTQEQQKKAVKTILDFYYEPTELTLKARSGIEAISEYVASKAN